MLFSLVKYKAMYRYLFIVSNVETGTIAHFNQLQAKPKEQNKTGRSTA